MKLGNVIFLFVAILFLSGIWPSGIPRPIDKPIPGQPPIIVFFPGGGK